MMAQRDGFPTSLLAIEEPQPETTSEPSPTAESAGIPADFQFVSLISDVNVLPLYQPENTPEVTEQVAAETTAEAAPTLEATVSTAVKSMEAAVSAGTPQLTSQYRDERWYGMTLGLVAIILIITVGMIANILRGLFRRRRT